MFNNIRRCYLIIIIIGSSQAQTPSLTIEQLTDLVSKQNPELIALSKEIMAAEGALLQSSLRPNPEFEFESGRGGDPETIAQLNQTFQLGGKRVKRTRVAKLELEQLKLNYTIKKLEIIKEAKSAFIDILLLQEIVNLSEEKIVVSRNFLTSVKQRVAAGRSSPAEESRAQVTLASNQIELNRTKYALKNRWRQLVSTWGSTISTYDSAIGDLNSIRPLPHKQSLDDLIDQSPLFNNKKIAIQMQKATVNLEQALRIPDLTVGAGLRRTDVPDDTYQIGFSIPIPLFDRNQGTILEAKARMEQVLDEKKALEIQIKTKLSLAYSKLQMAYDEIQSLKFTILPEAEKAYRIIDDGYLLGKFDYLDVVDAQNTLFETKGSLLNALSDYHNTIVELEALLGQTMNSFTKPMEE